jgi:hypothetical protein
MRHGPKKQKSGDTNRNQRTLEQAGSKPQSRSEADFCRPGPLTGLLFAFSINTHVKNYTKTTCVVLKNKAKARHARGHGLHNILSIKGL